MPSNSMRPYGVRVPLLPWVKIGVIQPAQMLTAGSTSSIFRVSLPPPASSPAAFSPTWARTGATLTSMNASDNKTMAKVKSFSLHLISEPPPDRRLLPYTPSGRDPHAKKNALPAQTLDQKDAIVLS